MRETEIERMVKAEDEERERERERVRMRECKYRRIKFNLFDRNERSLEIVTKEKTCASYYI